MTTIKIPLSSEASHSIASSTQEIRATLSDMSLNLSTSKSSLFNDTQVDAGVQTRRKSSRRINQMPQQQCQQDQDDNLQVRETTSDESILHTPRRGRRVGKVDLGWESPLLSYTSIMVTPTKPKAKIEYSDSDSTVKLIDLQGRALAAMPRSYDENIITDFLHNSPNISIDHSHSRHQTQEEAAQLTGYNRLSGFERDEIADLLPALVPIELPVVGRMAIHRSQLSQIPCIDTSSLTQSNSEKDSISSSNSGNNSQSSEQTSLDTPNEMDTMPSFPLPSDFLYPELRSPSKNNRQQNIAYLLGDDRAGLTIEDKVKALRQIGQKDHCQAEAVEDLPIPFRPRLLGDGMPQLNWPDSPSGPWSFAGKELLKLQEQKRRGIARWLEEDSSDDDENNLLLSQKQQHPMVAKAMHDRARKEMLIRSLSMPTLRQNRHLTTPSKRSRRSKIKEEDLSPAKRRRGRKTKKLTFPHPLASNAASTSSVSSPCSTIGCLCGSLDDSTPMVQCNACKLWYHLACMGIAATDLETEWFCSGCCDMAAVLSPSSLGDRASLIATPNFPRSAAIAGQQLRPSQGQLPVFTQPASAHSPSTRIHHLQQQQAHQQQLAEQNGLPFHFPSSLALAPSPVLPIGSERRSSTAGRHRASRIGWQQLEPGSPLERKSGHRRNVSGGSTLLPMQQVHGSGSRRRIPTYDQQDAFYPIPPRTPSPQPAPSRKQSSSNLSGARSSHRRESSNRDYDDIYSTPSRILQGSASWGANASTSMMRHTREESGMAAATAATITTPWGLSTPIRSMMESDDFNSDRSEGNGGLPSLVYSSGGLADLADFNWQLQSPSSSTRAAARARQSSINRRYMTNTSSMREKTPTRQSSNNSIGQQYYHHSEVHSSSSPFPKTPTFQDLMQHHHIQQQQQHHSSNQHPLLHNNHHYQQQQQLQYSPSSAPSKPLHRMTSSHQLTPGNGMITNSYDSLQSRHSTTSTTHSLQHAIDLANEGNRRASIKSRQASHVAGTIANQARARNASSGELMAGLGIGLDLDDVLDWA